MLSKRGLCQSQFAAQNVVDVGTAVALSFALEIRDLKRGTRFADAPCALLSNRAEKEISREFVNIIREFVIFSVISH